MTLLPRTLLGRTILVLILTVALTEIATQMVFRYFVSDEFSRSIVRVGSNNITAIGLALRALPPAARADYAVQISESSGYQVVPGATLTLPADVGPADASRLQQLEQRLQERLSAKARVYVEGRRTPQRVWIRLPVDGGDWWVRFERTRFDRAFPMSAALLLASSLVLAVAVAWFTVRRINQPLRAIQENILRLSRGDEVVPTRAPEGPAEVSDLAEAVDRMAGALTQAGDERALLLAGVSHDLRTPLARLRLAVEMLAAESTQDREALVDDIEEIDRTIGQFLDFARDIKVHPNVEEDLANLLQDCAERARAHGCSVVTEFAGDLRMPMRRPALERLINNLVENARRYAGPHITLRACRTPEGLRLAVLDRGPGIPPDQATRLVQPFTRLDASRTGPAGAGLGLAIVDRIARNHQGRLQLLPRQGGGLEARVDFVLSRPSASPTMSDAA